MSRDTSFRTSSASRARPSRLSRLLAAALCAIMVWSLVFAPCAQAFYFGGVTLKDEKEMGRKFDVLVRSSLPMVQDPEISDYVKGLVARISKAIPPQPFAFQTGVILHNAMNAFAVPGGYVYVFTGLLMHFESEAQVAGVLCHELAHVTQRHVASRLERAQIVTLGSLLLAVAGIAAGGGAGGAIATASLSAGQAAMLNYSRADETEADQVGLQYLAKAGYPPSGMVGGFKILRQKSWMSGSRVPAYLSTHPDIGDRTNGIGARIQTLPRSIQARTCDDTRFKRMQVLLWGRHGDPSQALQRFRGQDALSLMGRGMVYSRLNNVSEASRCFEAAMAKDPRDPLVLREAGIFHYRKGDAGRAGLLLGQALQKDPRDYMAKYFLARMLDDEGRRPQAQAEFREVLRYVPEESDVHESLGKSYGAGGRQGLAYVHLCYAALYAHKKELAGRYFDKAKALQGQNPQEFKRLDTVYKERKEIWKKL